MSISLPANQRDVASHHIISHAARHDMPPTVMCTSMLGNGVSSNAGWMATETHPDRTPLLRTRMRTRVRSHAARPPRPPSLPCMRLVTSWLCRGGLVHTAGTWILLHRTLYRTTQGPELRGTYCRVAVVQVGPGCRGGGVGQSEGADCGGRREAHG